MHKEFMPEESPLLGTIFILENAAEQVHIIG